MKIGINLLYLLPGVVGGTETYAAGLLQGLAEIDRHNEYVVFVNREGTHWPLPQTANIRRLVCPVSAARRGVRYFFEQVRLPRLLAAHRIAVVHSLGYVGPLFAGRPSVVTIPDCNFEAMKHTLPNIKRAALRFFSMQSARRADQVVTISDFSKKEICRLMNLNSDRITVTHLAARQSGPKDDPKTWEELAGLYRIRKPYVVAFGGGVMHKNIPRLIRAFALLKDTVPHFLVLIGHLPPDVSLANEPDAVRNRIVCTGYVPEGHVPPLLRHADVFVLPSLYEGFGLPVLEAQQAAVPVVCSRAGSLTEVGGAGALYFDPASVNEMADAMRQCLTDAALRFRLIRKGRENLSRFSWDQTAQKTLRVYQGVSGAGKGLKGGI